MMEGKIYKIVSPHTDKIYIGSTKQKLLCNRMSKHRYSAKHNDKNNFTMSYEVLQYGEASIHLIEKFMYNDIIELRMREQYHIERNNCVNRQKSYISNEDRIKRDNKYKLKYKTKNIQLINDKKKIVDAYKKSWGGDLRSWNNNLLKINPNLFH